MTLLVSEIIKPVSFILNDVQRITHTEDDLVSAVNMAVRTICSIRSDASTDIGTLTLMEGALQSLPPHALRLLDGCYRMDDKIRQQPLTLISLSDIDRLDPNWMSQPPGNVRELAYDERLSGQFWCIPPAKAGDEIELMFTTLPEAITSLSADCPLSDKYAPVIVEYVLYLMFARDSENSRNSNRASGHLQTCLQLLGMKSQADLQVSPNKPEE